MSPAAVHRHHLLVVGPNLAIDRTARIAGLHPGGVLRTGPVAVTPGGKGVNVVRAALRLGASGSLVGFVAGHLGQAVGLMLADEGVDLIAVQIPGETRSTAILTDDAGRTTVINEPGPVIDAVRWEAYRGRVAERLEAAAVLVCSGSSPPGTPPGAYGELVEIARRRRILVVVDAGGPLLEAAVRAGADLVTPNLAEAEALLHRSASERVVLEGDVTERAAQAAAALVSRGARRAMVTAAAAGVAVAWEAGLAWVAAPAVRVVNPVGAGDAFTAAAALALAAEEEPVAAAQAGTAAGAAAVETALAGDLDPERVAILRRTLRERGL